MCVWASVCYVCVCVCARLYVAYLTGQATIYGAFAWTETERERKRDRHTYTHTHTHSHTPQLWFIFDFDYKQSNNLPHPETVPMGPTCCSHCCCCPALPCTAPSEVCVSVVCWVVSCSHGCLLVRLLLHLAIIIFMYDCVRLSCRLGPSSAW